MPRKIGTPLDPSHPDHRPLSDSKVQEFVTDSGLKIRVDQQGRLLCNAKRRDGELCKSPAVSGVKVCRMHGASTPQGRNATKLRMQELVSPAIAQLGRLLVTSDKDEVRLRAAVEVLDRTGHGKQQSIEIQDARALLLQRILEMREGEAEASIELEATVVEEGDGRD